MKVAHTTCNPHEVKKCLKTLTNVSDLAEHARMHTLMRTHAHTHIYTLVHKVGTIATNTEKIWQTPATQGAGHGSM